MNGHLIEQNTPGASILIFIYLIYLFLKCGQDALSAERRVRLIRELAFELLVFLSDSF